MKTYVKPTVKTVTIETDQLIMVKASNSPANDSRIFSPRRNHYYLEEDDEEYDW